MVFKTLPENLHQRPHFEQFWVAAGQEHTFDQIQLSGSSFSISSPLMQILQEPRTLLPSAPNSPDPQQILSNSSNPAANSFQFFEPSSEFLPIFRTLYRILSNSSNPPANSSKFFEPSSEFIRILRTLPRILPNSSNPPCKCSKFHEPWCQVLPILRTL